MATLKMNETRTPSEEIVEEALRVVRVTDTLGRSIGVRKMRMSMRRRMLKVISPEAASRDRYLGLVALAACCAEIDGEEIRFPTTELQFDALIDRLDDAGFEAIQIAMTEHLGIGSVTDLDEAKN